MVRSAGMAPGSKNGSGLGGVRLGLYALTAKDEGILYQGSIITLCWLTGMHLMSSLSPQLVAVRMRVGTHASARTLYQHCVYLRLCSVGFLPSLSRLCFVETGPGRAPATDTRNTDTRAAPVGRGIHT